MTNIILIHPIIMKSECHFCPLPLNLLSISNLLDKEDYKIKIIDQRINPDWKGELIKELKNEPTCVGITSMVGAQILGGLKASKIVKENSGAPVVWGGPFPTISPQLTIENENVDVVCEGEGEVTFYELVKTLEKGKSLKNVKGIWYKNNGNIIRNEKRPFVDLNDIPDMPYHLLNMKDYKHTSWQTEEFTINLESSRGCPFRCKYCYNPTFYPLWRALKPERVVEMLKKLVDTYKVRSFLFHDDNFFVNQKRTNEIMKGVLEEKLDIIMGFQGIRADSICNMKKEELYLIYKAGSRYFNFGLETGSQRILDLLNKGVTVEQAYQMNRKLAEYPVMPHYNLMVGLPTETIEDLHMTLDMILKLKKENPNVKIPTIFLFIPWPGTKMYDIAIKHGFVPPRSLEEWGEVEWTALYKNQTKLPWLSNEFIIMFKKLLLTYQLAYNPNISNYQNFFFKMLAKLYQPIAKFRFKHKFYDFMPEILFAEKISRFARKRYAD